MYTIICRRYYNERESVGLTHQNTTYMIPTSYFPRITVSLEIVEAIIQTQN